jgi:hypothetical protein
MADVHQQNPIQWPSSLDVPLASTPKSQNVELMMGKSQNVELMMGKCQIVDLLLHYLKYWKFDPASLNQNSSVHEYRSMKGDFTVGLVTDNQGRFVKLCVIGKCRRCVVGWVLNSNNKIVLAFRRQKVGEAKTGTVVDSCFRPMVLTNMILVQMLWGFGKVSDGAIIHYHKYSNNPAPIPIPHNQRDQYYYLTVPPSSKSAIISMIRFYLDDWFFTKVAKEEIFYPEHQDVYPIMYKAEKDGICATVQTDKNDRFVCLSIYNPNLERHGMVTLVENSDRYQELVFSGLRDGKRCKDFRVNHNISNVTACSMILLHMLWTFGKVSGDIHEFL